HVGNADVFYDTPEIAGISVLHLHFDGAREHAVEGTWSRRVHQHTGVPGRRGEAVFDLQPVVAVAGIGDEMPAGLTQAHEQPVAHEEWTAEPRVRVGGGDIGVPAGEVLAVEEALWRALRRTARRPTEPRGHADGEDR